MLNFIIILYPNPVILDPGIKIKSGQNIRSSGFPGQTAQGRIIGAGGCLGLLSPPREYQGAGLIGPLGLICIWATMKKSVTPTSIQPSLKNTQNAATTPPPLQFVYRNINQSIKFIYQENTTKIRRKSNIQKVQLDIFPEGNTN